MHVNSVNGPIDTKNLGLTLMHEHVANINVFMRYAFPDWFDKEYVLGRFSGEIDKISPYGLKTFVDCTPINLGRDVNLCKEAAMKTGLQIICATGLYYMENPWYYIEAKAEVYAKYLIRDIQDGIQGTDIKAAIIKCASDACIGLTKTNRVFLEGSALAAKETGAPVYTHHTPDGEMGFYQQDILMKNGVAPHKIVIGHAFDSCDVPYIEKLIKNGTYVGCDRIGVESFTGMEPENVIACVAELCKRGYSKHIILSHDSCAATDFGYSLSDVRKDDKNPIIFDYCTIFRTFIPGLLKLGVPQEQIDEMMIANPRRYFEGQPIT